MASTIISALKAEIDGSITTNHAQAITGEVLNDVLNDTADAIESETARLAAGGSYVVPVDYASDVKGRISGGTSYQVVFDPSSTATIRVRFFPVELGKTYNVRIPKTGNNYTRVMGYTNSVFDEDITPNMHLSGKVLSTTGNSGAYEGTFTSEGGHYVVFTYDSASGDPTFEEVVVVRGLATDEADIAELQGQMEALAPVVTGTARYESILGEAGVRVTAATLGVNGTLEAASFPRSNKCGNAYALSCKLEAAFQDIIIAQGYDTYRCVYFVIDGSTASVWYKQTDGAAAVQKATLSHGLTISTFLQVNIAHGDNGKYTIAIDTLGGSFKGELDWSGYDANGTLSLISHTALSGVVFSATNRKHRCPLWVFGASYEGVTSDRWVGQAKSLGYFDYLVNGYAGRGPHDTYDELVRALSFGCPKFLYWTMFGNGTAGEYATYTGLVKTLCEEKGITLVLINRPNSPAVSSKYSAMQSAIGTLVAEGVRCVDVRDVLSSDPTDPTAWYDGYLASDDTHPTTLGAKAIAWRVLADLPEIMQYK